MANDVVLWRALDAAFWELGEALTDMPDADLWRRAHPKLLSVGELTAHIAYGEWTAFISEEPASSLATDQVQYYLSNVDEMVAMPLGMDEVRAELDRIHQLSKTTFYGNSWDLDQKNPLREDWTWEYTLIYMAFHLAYHTGQIYSVRHLLGHETVDN
jgi:uncharacterized damage-inducible protein DinB